MAIVIVSPATAVVSDARTLNNAKRAPSGESISSTQDGSSVAIAIMDAVSEGIPLRCLATSSDTKSSSSKGDPVSNQPTI